MSSNSESVSVIHRHALVALGSLAAQMKQSPATFLEHRKKQTVNGPHIPPTSWASFTSTNTYCASQRFQVALCLNAAVTRGAISAVDLKKCWKICGTVQWSLSHTGWCIQGLQLVFFPSSDANTALKATTIIRGGRMLSILLFSANLCGNQHSLALSGAGHGINTGPTYWLESWDVHSLYTLGCEIGERRVFSCVCVWGGGLSGYHDHEHSELNVVFPASCTGSTITQLQRTGQQIPCAWIKLTVTHSFVISVIYNLSHVEVTVVLPL